MIILSVILPLYNGESFIADTVQSLEEANKDITFELVIVNDGSTDKSLTVARELSEQYPNVKVLTKPNGGIASAREHALQNCNGKYVAFCDQDDKVIKGYSSFVARMEEHHSDMLMANHCISVEGQVKKNSFFKEERFYQHTECVDLSKMLFCPEVFTPEDASERHLTVLPGSVWNCIFRLEFIRANCIHFQSNVNYEDDWLFVGQALGFCNSLCVVPEAFYCWTVNPQSESHTPKFIHDFFTKRESHKALLLGYADRLEADEEQHKRFEHILDAQTVMVGARNAMILPYRDYLREIQQLKAFEPLRQYADFKVGRLSKLYLWLWANHLYRLAYLMNKTISLIR